MAYLVNRKVLNSIVAHIDEVRDEVHANAKDVGRDAASDLERVRASTKWDKIHGPSHLTKVDVTQGDVDSFVNLEAPNPEAIEYGHQPSGVFGPGGALGHVKTKAPEGLYILSKAAGLA